MSDAAINSVALRPAHPPTYPLCNAIQQAARANSREAYKMYVQIVDETNTKCNLRGQIKLKVRLFMDASLVGGRAESCTLLVGPPSSFLVQRMTRTFLPSPTSSSPYINHQQHQYQQMDPSRAVPLEEVEPAAEIVKRFNTGACVFVYVSWMQGEKVS